MMDRTQEEPAVAAPRRRRLRLFVSLGLAAVATAVLVFFWMYPAHESTRSFQTPKITIAHVDEEPFMRVELAEGQSYRPIELMAGTEVTAVCEVVSHAASRSFALTAFGERQEAPDCTFAVRVPDQVGLEGQFTYEFRDGGAAEPTDVMLVPVIVVAPGERMELQGLEDGSGRPLSAVSVPARVKVYARAITGALPGPSKDYVALFFVADPVNGVPVLQLAPMEEGEDGPVRPLLGTVVRYRSYGKDLAGHAIWSLDALDLGGADTDRRVHDIYVGVFRRSEVDSVFAKTLSVERTGPDSVAVKPLVTDADAVRALTVQGRLLSPPFHVVRGPGHVETRGTAGR